MVVTNPSQHGRNAGRDHLTPIPFCIQSQHAKRIEPYKKLREAKGSAGPDELSVAILRKDRHPIIAVMEIGEWLQLVAAALRNS